MADDELPEEPAVPWWEEYRGDSLELPDDLYLIEPLGVVEWDPGEHASTASTASAKIGEDVAPPARLGRSISSMALGTAFSRLTGLLRILVLAYALGLTPIADAFNLANTIPNMVFDLVLGGVIAATFVPVFIQQLETRKQKDAWRSISAVLTLALVLLGIATVLCVALAPWIIQSFTSLHTGGTTTASAATLESQRHAATVLLRWFAPQVFFYGLIALTTALLNIQRIFAPPMWVAVANNVVCIGVLILFASAGRAPSLEAMASDPNRLLLLGLGSTLGVVVQALLLLPFLLKTETRYLWWRLDLQDLAVKATMKLGSWTVGLVIANQIALFIILALAFGLGGNGEVSAYSYAWVFFQTPYAIISISVMSGLTPALSSAYAQGDLESYRTQFGKGLRSVLVIILPLSVLLFIVAKPLLQLLLGLHGNGAGQAVMAGHALAAFALGLPGFCAFQLAIRAFQTRHAGHQAFWLYLFENGLTIVLAVLLVDHLGVTGLALANSIAYCAAALIGLLWLRSSTGRLGDTGTFRPLLRVSIASFAMGIVAIVGINVSASTSTGGLVVRLMVCGLGALAAYGLAVVVLAQYERGR